MANGSLVSPIDIVIQPQSTRLDIYHTSFFHVIYAFIVHSSSFTLFGFFSAYICLVNHTLAYLYIVNSS